MASMPGGGGGGGGGFTIGNVPQRREPTAGHRGPPWFEDQGSILLSVAPGEGYDSD